MKQLAGLVLLAAIIFTASGGCDDESSRWTRQFTDEGGLSRVEGSGVAVDASGNSYITGVTRGMIGDQMLTGASGAYVVSFDAAGVRRWSRILDAAGLDTAGQCVAVDSAGGVYVAGTTNGDLGAQGVTGLCDLFVAKFDSDGRRIWIAQAGP